MNRTEEKLIEDYRKSLAQYERPSVTADIIAMRPAFADSEGGSWRENPKFAIEMLLIRRGKWPDKGKMALPGGFIQGKNRETVEQGAIRELREECGLVTNRLIPIGVFSKYDRDPRTWIISNAYVSFHKRNDGANVRGGDDAADAMWLRILDPKVANGRFELPFFLDGTHCFTLRGCYEGGAFGDVTITEVTRNELAFDHAEIIAAAFVRMLAFDPLKLALLFLDKKFTLSEFADVYQYLTHTPIGDMANFRRKVTSGRFGEKPYLVPCRNEFAESDRAHPKARLFRRG